MKCPLSDDDVRAVLSRLPVYFDTLDDFIAACPRSGGTKVGEGCEVVRHLRGPSACRVRLGLYRRTFPSQIEQAGLNSPAGWRQEGNKAPSASEHAPVAVRRRELAVALATATAGPVAGAREIFLSHATGDLAKVEQVCALLEAAGVRCWMASRDVMPGENYPGAIVRAIRGAKAFVLFHSAAANSSEHVLREVEHAAKHKLPITAVRLEETPFSDDLEYFVSLPQRIEAYRGELPAHVVRLVNVLRR